jgi:hypothetical protein
MRSTLQADFVAYLPRYNVIITDQELYLYADVIGYR